MGETSTEWGHCQVIIGGRESVIENGGSGISRFHEGRAFDRQRVQGGDRDKILEKRSHGKAGVEGCRGRAAGPVTLRTIHVEVGPGTAFESGGFIVEVGGS